ncbi:antirestriction protein ArdC [Janthinobacterium sp. 61]|uniref:ArdC family protein n=1 Tax=Janthinobacterium sp. 61 TaxID=2035209 RepID=UPI000C70579D|nr:zincin-like metallopeptidase domain-containing protein [Janthinobacterium sp. 61]PKV44460.1 antirestriction protein ArdC [Janthinobacterium sp. 61]
MRVENPAVQSNGHARSAGENVGNKADVKSEIALTLIEAMKSGNTPWQRPWAAQALRPVNLATNNGYRGINRLLLALGSCLNAEGRSDPRWATYQQAQANGWQVRRGEKGTPIVKLVEVGKSASPDAHQSSSAGNRQPADSVRSNANTNAGSGSRRGGGGGDAGGGPSGGRNAQTAETERKAFALRRYVVFNAQQMNGVPPLEAPSEKLFDPVARAEAVIQALKEKTGLLVVHGGTDACYVPALDEIRLPAKKSFHSVYDYYATALHEGAHSTLHKKRLDRQEAIAKRWGDEAYAVEELRAEICSAILAAETGVPMSQSHIDNHAAYLQHWIKAVSTDPMTIFSAAKDAELMAEYMLGLEKQMISMEVHKEWIVEYDRNC